MQKFDLTLICLSRLGDLTMLATLVNAIKLYKKNISICVISWEDEINLLEFLFPNNFFVKLKKSDCNDDHCQKLNAIIHCALVNLTFSPLSEILMHKTLASFKLGPMRNEERKIQIHDQWGQFIYSTILEGPLNPYHVLDLWAKMVGVPLKNSQQPSKANTFHLSKKIIVAIGSSHYKKNWLPLKWAEFLYHVLRSNNDVEIYFCGTNDQIRDVLVIEECELLQTFTHRLHSDYMGVPLESWIPIFKEYPLFIGHDSFFSHFANHFNIQCLIISLGSVRPQESSPYGPNHIIFTPKMSCYPCLLAHGCDHLSCHLEIDTVALAKFTQELLITNGTRVESILEKIPNIHVYSGFSIFQTILDDTGFRLKPLTSKTALNDVLNIYHILWSFLLEDIDITNYYKNIQFSANLNGYKDVVEKLLQFIEMTRLKTINCVTIEEILSLQSPMHNLCLDIKQQFPYLYPIVNFYYIKWMNIPGLKLDSIKENVMNLIQEYQSALLLFLDLTQKISNKGKYDETTKKTISY